MLRAVMRSYVVVSFAAVVLAVAALFLGWRQWALERRVDELTRQLGAANGGEAPAPAKADPGPVAAPNSSYSDRIKALEAGLVAVRADIRSLEKATADMPEKGATDQQILTVMKEQGAKVMEKQVAYHRERWLDQREQALNSFVKRFDLNQQQSDVLWGILSGEVDKMMDILRKPESFEDPEKFANEWKTMLLETDAAAHKTLDRDKSIAWDQQRQIERKFLWPWLPE
jgi:hypothetical protein